MNVIVTVAWRNTWRQKRRTLLTVSTIAFGLALILILKGLSDGALQQMIDSTVRMGSGHVVVHSPDYLDLGGVERHLSGEDASAVIAWLTASAGAYGIDHVVQRVLVSGLASSADGSVSAQIIGVDPGREPSASSYYDALMEGRFLHAEDAGEVVLGRGAAARLAVNVGDRVVLMAQGVHDELESILVRVAGIVRLGIDDIDDTLAIIPLAAAQRFTGVGGGAHQVAAVLADARLSPALAAAGVREFGTLDVLDWRDAHPELTDLIQLVAARDGLLSIVVLALVSFLVLNTLLMAVLERAREFALLEALGFVPLRRFLMVIAEATVIAALACVVGFALGFGVHHLFATTGLSIEFLTTEGLDVAGTVMEPVIYSQLSPQRIAQILALVFGLTVALALMPARRAARPAQIGHLGRK